MMKRIDSHVGSAGPESAGHLTLDSSNFDTYIDPPNYDRESGQFELEDSILLELAGQTPGPILELGCGTGRVAIPLAQRGLPLTALDVLPHMLQHARSKAKGLPITWIQGDVRHFELETRYSLIFTVGAVFQHLLYRSDQEAMLSRVRQHLLPEGQFVIDAGFKLPPSMKDVVQEQEWFTYTDDQGREVRVAGTDQYDHLRQIWRQTYYRRWTEGGAERSSQPIALDLRYTMPLEMEALLHYNGFQVLHRYGDWSGKPLTTSSYLQIYVCKPRI